MLVDLHVYTPRTPGCSLEPKEAIAHAKAKGLDGVCLILPDSLEGVEELHALRADAGIAVVVGVEVATDHGLFHCFFPEPEKVRMGALLPAGPAEERQAKAVVEVVLERGGAVVAAQPYDRDQPKPMGDFLFTLRELTAVEGWNGAMRVNVNELAIEAADHLGVPCVGGSGARASYDEIGRAGTLFRDEFVDEAGLVASLRSGAVWAVKVGEPPRFHGDEAVVPRERGGEERRREGRRDGRRDGRRGGRRGGRR